MVAARVGARSVRSKGKVGGGKMGWGRKWDGHGRRGRSGEVVGGMGYGLVGRGWWEYGVRVRMEMQKVVEDARVWHGATGVGGWGEGR